MGLRGNYIPKNGAAGGPFLPIAGGEITGDLTVDGALIVHSDLQALGDATISGVLMFDQADSSTFVWNTNGDFTLNANAHVNLTSFSEGIVLTQTNGDGIQLNSTSGDITLMSDGGSVIIRNGGELDVGISAAFSSNVGFYGLSPVSQQTGGAATAGALYTSTEQGMLNRAYSALRAYGLLT